MLKFGMEIVMDKDRLSKHQEPTAYIFNPFPSRFIRIAKNSAHLPYFKDGLFGSSQGNETGKSVSTKIIKIDQ